MINENINIDIFDKWALKNKDKGMEEGHAPSVGKMINVIKDRTNISDNNFKFLDLGCGNGWVVRKFSNDKLCQLAIGIDGSSNMIKKAKSNDKKGIYYQSKIELWNSNHTFDIIFSMETFYYLKNIDLILSDIYTNKLNANGFIIIGIDHYLENKPSLSWEKEIGIQTQTLSIKKWVDKFKKAGFTEIEFEQIGSKKDWAGTLIISAFKK